MGPSAIPFVSLSGGLIRVRVTGVGWASRLYRSGVFNVGSVHANDLRMNFSVEQLVHLDFDAAAERLSAAPFGAPAVPLNYTGPFAGYVGPLARDAIASQVQSRLGGVVAQTQNELAFFTAPARKATIIDQLRRIDGAATARFTDAVFRVEGMILRGVIPLSHRHVPHVSFEKYPDGDGFDAAEKTGSREVGSTRSSEPGAGSRMASKQRRGRPARPRSTTPSRFGGRRGSGAGSGCR